MQRPALLRMTNDDFMDELVDLLADDPDGSLRSRRPR